MNVQLSDLCKWGAAKRVETSQGPRNLRTAPANESFWAAWRADKASLKAAGISCSRNKDGSWEACWWLPLAAEEVEALNAASAASRAVDADIAIPVPAGLDYLPYQKAGIAYAISRDACLIGDEMGLGKTIQAIGVWNADASLKRTVIVCPASLRLNWAREFAKWATRLVKIAVVNGGKPSDFPVGEWDVLIVNYDVLGKHRDALDAFEIDFLIADEAHYLKNPKTVRTKAVLGFVAKGKRVEQAIKARRRCFLTGTPIVNRPIELFPLVEAIDPSGLGSNFFKFAKRYTNASHNGFGWDFTGASRLDELQRIMRERFLVRRLKSEVLTELPAKRRQVIVIPANGASEAVAAEQSAYAAKETRLIELRAACELAKCSSNPQDYRDAVQELKDGASAAFTEMAKARHEVAVAKVPYVADHLEQCLEEGPVVCFAHHKDVVHALAERFAGRCVILTGETSMSDRQQAVDDFQNGKVDLFIGNIQAAGVGITLVRSSHVVFAELDWVPGNMTQAEDRTHRIGQLNQVFVQHLVLEGSLDQVMAAAIIRKQEIIDKALDARVEALEADDIVLPSSVVIADSEPATANVKQDALQAAAEKITDEQCAAVHLCLQRLAGVCDGAAEIDGCGYNKIDARIGHSLANQGYLTKRQAALGQKLVRKYRRQLGAAALEAAGIAS